MFGNANVDIIKMVVLVQHVVQRNIVAHDLQVVIWQMYDIMQILHVVRRNVQMLHRIQLIQVMLQVIAVVGNVKEVMNLMQAIRHVLKYHIHVVMKPILVDDQ